MRDESAAMARRLYEAFNDRDWDTVLGFTTDDVEATVVPFGMTATGKDGLRGFLDMWVALSSDIKVELVAQHVAGSSIVNEIIGGGTHDGPLVTPSGEIAATGRHIEVRSAEVWDLDTEGKVRALRNYVDAATLFQQITDPARVEERIRAFYEEVANAGDHARIPEFATEDWVDHEDFPGISPTREGIGQFLTVFRQAFPDLHFTVDEVLVSGDRAVVRLRISGTHRGEFMGAPPTGNSFEISAIDILRMDGDRAAEHWGVTDAAAMLTQLGISETAATAT